MELLESLLSSYLISHLMVLGLLLLASMFFSAVETSLLSISRGFVHHNAQREDLVGTAFKEWSEHPNRILTSILIGNNAITIFATTFALYTVLHLAEENHWGWFASGSLTSLGVAIILIFFGEVIPKVMARMHSARLVVLLVVPIYLFDRLLTPLNWVLMGFIHSFFPRLGKASVAMVTEEDIKHLIEVGQEAGTIHESEKDMIHSIFKFTDTRVGKVMVPRTDIFAVELDTDFEKLVGLVAENGYSRLPVYKGNLDNIVGILHTRDLLSMWKNRELIVLQDLLRKPYFVPESMRVDRLLREFKRGKIHMAIVVDEYGGTSGLATLEDLIEEIVGEIHAEFEAEEEKAIVPQEDGSWLIEANISLDEVNSTVGTHLTAPGDVASLGGYLMEKFGRVPRKGRVIEDEEAIFTVLDANEKRVLKVRAFKRERVREDRAKKAGKHSGQKSKSASEPSPESPAGDKGTPVS